MAEAKLESPPYYSNKEKNVEEDVVQGKQKNFRLQSGFEPYGPAGGCPTNWATVTELSTLPQQPNY